MNDATDLRHSVANTLNEAIGMVDAEPMSNDFLVHSSLPTYTMRAILLHSALELGMKCMCVDGDLSDRLLKEYNNKFKSWGHDLVKIYRKLSDSDRELLDMAFKDAVSFYGLQVDRDEWTHMSDFETYLAKTGDKDLFLNFRYWYFEGDSRLFGGHMPDLTISREMARFISDVLNGYDNYDGSPVFVSKLVDIEVQKSFHQKGYQDNGNLRRFNEDPEALEEDFQILRQWVVNEHDSLMLAIKDAYEHDFDVLNDWSNTVLRSVYTSLKNTEDYRIRLALDYVFSTFGAKSSDCDAISSAQVRQVGRREQVRTPSGRRLGIITERHDGRWTAYDPRTDCNQLAFGRDDAVGLVIEKVTDIVSVALNGGTPREARVLFPNRLELYLTDYLRTEVLCEFWDAEHGIVTGDEINISGTRQDETRHIPRIRGIVKSVNNHEVTVSKHH